MTERPTKRARLDLVKTFLDLEAENVDDSDDDQEDDELVQGVDEDEDIPDDGSHLRLQQAIQASSTTATWDWEQFLGRAKERSQLESAQRPVAEKAIQNGILWEVYCRIGHEETLTFKLLQQATTSLTLARRFRSIVGKTSRPGRIYIEADERHDVEALIMGVANIGREILPVPSDRLESILQEPALPSISLQSWVRVRRGGRLGRAYEGEIGLVLTEERDFEIAMIPKIKGVQALLPRNVPSTHLSSASPSLNGRYQQKGRTYTDSGFLLCRFEQDELQLDHHHGIVPSQCELQLFHELKEMSPRALQSSLSAMERQNLKISDKVKVVSGELRNLVGDIRELIDEEAVIYVSSQDCSYSVPLQQLRAHYQVGDAVKITNGDKEGCWGWVVNVGASSLDVFLHSIRDEMTVSVLCTEHYIPNSTPIRSIRAQASPLPLKNHKHVHQGKQVIVVKKHAYKGYQGTIKDVLHDDVALVELSAKMKTIEIPLKNLALLSHHQRHIITVIKGETALDRQAINISNARACSSSAPRASTPTPPVYLDPTGAADSTWTPDASDTLAPSHGLLIEAIAHVEKTTVLGGSQVPRPSKLERARLLAAWETTRQIPGVHWLMHPALQGLRLKLYNIEDDKRVDLEYKGFDAKGVVVRQQLDPWVIVPTSNIRAVYPCQASQLVTPMDGEDAGEVFRVLTFDSWRCILRNVDKTVPKKFREKTIVTVLLIEVFPDLRNR